MRQFYFSFLLLSFLAVGSAVQAQLPVIQWQKSLGGAGYESSAKMALTNDGGYIIASTSESANGDVTDNYGLYDIWVVKLNAAGSIEWQKSYGGSGSETISNIRQTSDGGYIFGATTSSNDNNVTGNHGNDDFWVVKLTSTGTIVWQKCLGGTGSEILGDIKPTADGGYIAIGTTWSTNGDVTAKSGINDAWIVKLNSAGLIEWQKSVGGSSSEEGVEMQLTSDGGYLAAMVTRSKDGIYAANHSLSADICLLKLTASGVTEWQKIYGGTGNEVSPSLTKINDGGYMLLASSASNNGDVTGNHLYNGTIPVSDCWVVKLDNAGTIQWQKSYGGTNSDYPKSIAQTPDNGYIIAASLSYGSFNYDGDITGSQKLGSVDIWVLKITATGAIQWQNTYGGSQEDGFFTLGDLIMPLEAGGYIMCGTVSSNDGNVSGNHGAQDTWLVRFSACPSYGKINASVCRGDSYSFNGQQLTAAGVYYDTLTNATGCDSIVTLTLSVYATDRPVIVQNGTTLSATGTYASYQWLLNGQPVAGATGASYNYSLSGVYALIVTNANNCRIESDPFTVLPTGSVLQEGAMVIPNPAKDFVTIRFPNPIPSFYISIVSAEGKKMGLQSFKNTNAPVLDVRRLPAGVYLLRLFGTDGSKTSFKMIKGK